MINYRWLLTGTFCLLCFLAYGQSPVIQAQQEAQYQVDLEEARQQFKAQPELAISKLELVIRGSKQQNDKLAEAEAFFLLGKINEQINQPELALQRYQEASLLLRKAPPNSLVEKVNFRIGKILLTLGKAAEARRSFQACLDVAQSPAIATACKEGLADVNAFEKKYDDASIQYDSILKTYQMQKDSLSFARVEAKRSKVFVAQQDLPRARQSYLNSISNLPQENYDYQDYAPIEEASNVLQENSPTDEERLTLNLDAIEKQEGRSLPVEAQIKQQIQIADLYIAKDNLLEAEKYIEASKDAINKNSDIDPEQKAKVFQKASEIQLKKGTYEKALAEYQDYMAENEKALQLKKSTLDQHIDIVQKQSQIDLIVTDLALDETRESLLKNQIHSQKILIGLLLVCLVGAALALYFIFQNVRNRRRANQLLLLKSLRTQMNPHFIFNALNSVNHYISQSDERSANKFLADFARLMRLVLEHSKHDFISLQEEIQLITIYLKLEHQRFRDKFKYEMHIDKGLTDQALQIPPMLVQPLVENSVWHGLRYKEGDGQLRLTIRRSDDAKNVIIEILDNGIGREQSKALKTKHQSKYASTGIGNIHHRIKLINQLYNKNYQIAIEDAFPGQTDPGTKVQFTIPDTHDIHDIH